MADRFYFPELLESPVVALSGSESHHLQHVLRLDVGDAAELFDGRGNVALAEVLSLQKRTVELRVTSRNAEATDRGTELILGAAVPKGERFRWLVEKATELGVTRLVPLQTERSVVRPGSGKLAKMQQTVIAACKQSGRNRLMAIDKPVAWDDFVMAEFSDHTVLLADPTGEPLDRVVETDCGGDAPAVAAVGPEGGFTADEITLAVEAGARLVNLGRQILRIETAAIALAAILGQRMADRGGL